jgi:hypothetical protein
MQAERADELEQQLDQVMLLGVAGVGVSGVGVAGVRVTR